jgi:hypothetical protein
MAFRDRNNRDHRAKQQTSEVGLIRLTAFCSPTQRTVRRSFVFLMMPAGSWLPAGRQEVLHFHSDCHYCNIASSLKALATMKKPQALSASFLLLCLSKSSGFTTVSPATTQHRTSLLAKAPAGDEKKLAMDPSKQAALDGVLNQIERSYGRGSIVKLGSTDHMRVECISSGALTLDAALGGGFPRGRVVEIYGPESSGKTTLALHAIAESQKQGGTAAFVDAEHALDPAYGKLHFHVHSGSLSASQHNLPFLLTLANFLFSLR